MKRFAELLVRTADLAEAEGRAAMDALRAEGRYLRSYLARLGLSLVCLAGAVGLFIAGFALLGVAEYQALLSYCSSPAAAALTGLSMLLIGSASLWIYHHNTKR